MILSFSKPVIESVDDVKQYNSVRILCLVLEEENRLFALVEHQVELGGEIFHGQPSNNPLYQLADEYHLLNENSSRYYRYDLTK